MEGPLDQGLKKRRMEKEEGGGKKGQMVKFGGNLRAEFDWERVRLGRERKETAAQT